MEKSGLWALWIQRLNYFQKGPPRTLEYGMDLLPSKGGTTHSLSMRCETYFDQCLQQFLGNPGGARSGLNQHQVREQG